MRVTDKLFRFFALFALLLAAHVQPGLAEPNSWDGTWKLNPAKSQLSGPTFIIKVLGRGEFQITTRSFNYKLICDGRYRPVVGDRSLACLKASTTIMDTAEREKGKFLNTVHRELSADDKTLIQTMVTIDEHGRKRTSQAHFVRDSKSTGLEGSWSDANGLDRQPQIMVTQLTGSVFRLSFPIEKQYTDMKLDGSDASTHGSVNGAGLTLSVKPAGSQRLLTVRKVNGTVVSQGVLILSGDGRSITEETSRPETPTAKTMLVYEKK